MFIVFTDGIDELHYQNYADGSRSVSWSNCSSFFGGKGRNYGKAERSITYSGAAYMKARFDA
ncbi:hypothetical protein B0T25DRAFT_563375 [Lasiosphaeria hispida]|uniref:GH11 domain-containing protein n=1 Tax=Lasiosphaeria hispida TaxID=260671 RepID=A0AAJ0ML76_9PEZI|nr:hypothetical protein B0T25DRAFT_563375 [Lasiosphaeria hispida]